VDLTSADTAVYQELSKLSKWISAPDESADGWIVIEPLIRIRKLGSAKNNSGKPLEVQRAGKVRSKTHLPVISYPLTIPGL
jgi:hypothetical protein